MHLHRDYHLEFSAEESDESMSVISTGKYNVKNILKFIFFIIKLASSTTKKSGRFHKISTYQTVRGHVMKIKQFNHPVHCAICHGFIWYFTSFVYF